MKCEQKRKFLSDAFRSAYNSYKYKSFTKRKGYVTAVTGPVTVACRMARGKITQRLSAQEATIEEEF